jgi:hypothetical protein
VFLLFLAVRPQIMQNKGYFAPWSRENGWVDRVAIDNIRKANTPQVPNLPRLSLSPSFPEVPDSLVSSCA